MYTHMFFLQNKYLKRMYLQNIFNDNVYTKGFFQKKKKEHMYKNFDICTKFTNFQRREYLQKYVYFPFKCFFFSVKKIIDFLCNFISYFFMKNLKK